MRRPPSRHIPNLYLGSLAVILIGCALVTSIRKAPSTVVVAFVFGAVALAVVSVFEPRMEGKLKITPKELSTTLAKSPRVRAAIVSAESEVKTGGELPSAKQVFG